MKTAVTAGLLVSNGAKLVKGRGLYLGEILGFLAIEREALQVSQPVAFDIYDETGHSQ